jgi:hypothetical protein|tara:strand:- start:94 stop:345 length:252 start_codon:yes stop_codon:yes gene_type:complete
MNKLETLKSALVARNDEVEGYQVNIDNYERAIAKIDAEYADNPPIVDFRNKLEEMLGTNKIEQLKAIIIRDVVADQITELEAL